MPDQYVFWEYDTDDWEWHARVTSDIDDAPVCDECARPVHSGRTGRDPYCTIASHDTLTCTDCGGELDRKDPVPGDLIEELGDVQLAVLAAVDDLTDRLPYEPPPV